MKLGSLIDKDFILAGDAFSTVDEAVKHLVDLFARKKKLPVSAEETMKIIKEREKLGGTVFPTGIAFPHGRIEKFDDLLIGVWIPPKTILSEDKEVKALFFSITSKAGSPLYLPVLAALSRFSQDSEAFGKLVSASTRTEIKSILDDISLKEEVTVEDIMTPDPITCTKDTTIAKLADLFYEKGLSFVPVVDNNGKQIGEVTIKDLLSKGVPDYVRRLSSTKFLKTLEPFEALLRDEDIIKVSEIMRKPTRKISPGSSIIEAVIMITDKGFRHLPVVKDGKVIGIISEMDILKKVLRS